MKYFLKTHSRLEENILTSKMGITVNLVLSSSMRTSHARRPLHTQCELSRTNQGLLVAEMRFAAASATATHPRRHRCQTSSLDQEAALSCA